MFEEQLLVSQLFENCASKAETIRMPNRHRDLFDAVTWWYWPLLLKTSITEIMVPQPSCRCLSLPPPRIPASLNASYALTPVSTAPFSTSSTPFSRVQTATIAVRGARTTFIKKKKKFVEEDKSRRPAPGERKALRKRIVLSNTNALEVQGLSEISNDKLRHEEFKGQVLGISNPVIDQLRAVEAFKTTQAWGFFRKPAMLVRDETVELGRTMEEVQKDSRTVRRVLVGEKGSGKSLLALQAMTMGFLKGWTVINIPEGIYLPCPFHFISSPITQIAHADSGAASIAQELTIGHTPYAPLPSTSLFTQKLYLTSLLTALHRANPHLEHLTLSSPPSNFPIPIPDNIALSRLASLGASDPDIAPQTFSLLLSELTLPPSSLPPDQHRPPLLLSMDSLAHALKPETAYRTASFKPIHALDLAVVDTFMGFLSGKTALPNGGLVLAVTSASNTLRNPSLDLALSQLQPPSHQQQLPTLAVPDPNHHNSVSLQGNPFTSYDPRVLAVFRNSNPGKVEVQEVKGLSRVEARGLMEYWARSGLVREVVSEGFVSEKWSLSGGGLVGEMERGVLGGRI